MIEVAPAIRPIIQVPEVQPIVAQLNFLTDTAPLTLVSKRADLGGVLERAKVILDSVPPRFKLANFKKDDRLTSKMEYYRFTRRKGRGPCPGCMASTKENHHGGSKCTRRGQEVSLSTKQNIIQFPTRIPNIIPFPTRLPRVA